MVTDFITYLDSLIFHPLPPDAVFGVQPVSLPPHPFAVLDPKTALILFLPPVPCGHLTTKDDYWTIFFLGTTLRREKSCRLREPGILAREGRKVALGEYRPMAK